MGWFRVAGGRPAYPACVKVLLGQSGRGGTRGGAGKAAQEVVKGIFVFCKVYVEREVYVTCGAVDPVFWFILADSRGNVYGGAVGVDSFWEGGGDET